MRHARPTPHPHQHNGRRALTLTLALALVALAGVAIAPGAEAAAGPNTIKLNSTIFAAQIGSTPPGASVYAGAVVDPTLEHGAIVYSASGSTAVRVIFHEFFAIGSISGTGHLTVVPGTNGSQATFTGSLTVTSGTGEYQQSRGKLSTRGNINNTGMVKATLEGSFTY